MVSDRARLGFPASQAKGLCAVALGLALRLDAGMLQSEVVQENRLLQEWKRALAERVLGLPLFFFHVRSQKSDNMLDIGVVVSWAPYDTFRYEQRLSVDGAVRDIVAAAGEELVNHNGRRH